LEGAGISEEERQVALAIAASLEGAGGGATSTARAAASPAIPEAIETRALAKADLIALEARALAKPFGTVPLMTALDDKSPLASGAKRYYYSSSVADSSARSHAEEAEALRTLVDDTRCGFARLRADSGTLQRAEDGGAAAVR